jgi:hypothetical protein
VCNFAARPRRVVSETTFDGTLICAISIETYVSEDSLTKHVRTIRAANPRFWNGQFESYRWSFLTAALGAESWLIPIEQRAGQGIVQSIKTVGNRCLLCFGSRKPMSVGRAFFADLDSGEQQQVTVIHRGKER